MRVCHCTNQCRACGQCCQIPCDHRGFGTFGYATTRTMPPVFYTEADIRRIIREELERSHEKKKKNR